MSYWPQQLNFSLWCATTGCGISIRTLFNDEMTDSELVLPSQVRSFLWFHVYFAVRRILYEMGGVQGPVALPGDTIFELTKNKYDIPSYNGICNEFGIDKNSDFWFNKGKNNGLGNVYIWVTRVRAYKTGQDYPGFSKFSDEGGSVSKGNLIQYIENLASSDQYEYFVTPVSYGLTSAGQARINQSIEAFVYCILSSQVNVRSSIIGSPGSAKEVRREVLFLIENAIGNQILASLFKDFSLLFRRLKLSLTLQSPLELGKCLPIWLLILKVQWVLITNLRGLIQI